jgi:hypothetical protein
MESIVKETASGYYKPNENADCFTRRKFEFFYKPQDYMLFLEKEFLKPHSIPAFIVVEADYTFHVIGKTFKIPARLKHMAQQIVDATEILSYPDNWDDDGALATNNHTFEQAATFIMDYAVYIYHRFAMVLSEPYIDMLRDGSVTVHWKSEKGAQLFIIFKKEEGALAYYYAESSERKIPLNSAIEPGAPVEETLALWMKNHL